MSEKQRALTTYEHFAFKVGETVQSAVKSHIKYQIIERIYQECPGGIQLWYACRTYDGARISVDLMKLQEIELTHGC